MKKSLIALKNLRVGSSYWCLYNSYSVALLMKFVSGDEFEYKGGVIGAKNVRVMFEGYINTNKSFIPKKFVLVGRYYWCKVDHSNELSLMRFDGNDVFYFIAQDIFLSTDKIKVIFEDYEHG